MVSQVKIQTLKQQDLRKHWLQRRVTRFDEFSPMGLLFLRAIFDKFHRLFNFYGTIQLIMH
jgi:hypothetical protein